MRGDSSHWRGRKWKLLNFNESDVKPRYSMGVAMLSNDKILLLGGEQTKHQVSHEILEFDTKSR